MGSPLFLFRCEGLCKPEKASWPRLEWLLSKRNCARPNYITLSFERSVKTFVYLCRFYRLSAAVVGKLVEEKFAKSATMKIGMINEGN